MYEGVGRVRAPVPHHERGPYTCYGTLLIIPAARGLHGDAVVEFLANWLFESMYASCTTKYSILILFPQSRRVGSAI